VACKFRLWNPLTYLFNGFLTCDRIPAWKHLIDCPLGTNERIPLIADIFSNCDETEVVKCLSGDDAQSFVDVVDEVLPYFFLTSEGPTDLNSNF